MRHLGTRLGRVGNVLNRPRGWPCVTREVVVQSSHGITALTTCIVGLLWISTRLENSTPTGASHHRLCSFDARMPPIMVSQATLVSPQGKLCRLMRDYFTPGRIGR